MMLGKREFKIVKTMLIGYFVYCLLCWGLTTRQPMRVILCRLPEKGRKEIEESRGDKRGTGKKEEQE